MFETAELGRKVAKKDYKERVPILREQLLEAQGRVRTAGFPVIVLFAGVDGAGKGETVNLLNEWMDPHWIVTRAFGPPSDEERERPEFWRYWRDLPAKGEIGLFLSAWYHRPLLDRVYGKISKATFDDRLDEIEHFERTLAADGALVLKFWMHLGKKQQKARLETLEQDKFLKWRVNKTDWKHWRMYDKFIAASERTIMRTSTGRAPWTIVEGADARHRSLRVGQLLLEGIHRHFAQFEALAQVSAAGDRKPRTELDPEEEAHPEGFPLSEDPVSGDSLSILSTLDLSKTLGKARYKSRLKKCQARLNILHRRAREKKVSTLLVFEGWDAGGKGGAIRRITAALDSRDVRVIPVAAPTDEENAQHYLWRFWRHLPRAGRFTIFDRSWYGRVLVERVEGFATYSEWWRAYSEINDFEQQLVADGGVLVKFWFHVSREEQAARFKAREQVAYKRWKLTPEDWRNREKWTEYEAAVNDMVARTGTSHAPWVLVEGNDKKYARIKALEAVCAALEKRLEG